MSHLRHRRRRGPLAKLAAAAMIVSLAVFGVFTAQADETNPYERGPDPTEESIRSKEGPFEYDKISVSAQAVDDFGGGTIYYPTDTSEGTFGAVAISPGYSAGQNTMSWLGDRLASQGFVVITIDTLSRSDWAESRGEQLLAALDYLTQSSEVKDRIDPERLGVMGHSMGGGGALEAAEADTSLQAAIPLAGASPDTDFSGVTTPVLVVGAENDSVAPVETYSEPYYESLPEDGSKAYLELNNAGHLAPVSDNETIGAYAVSWLKRFIDDDTRYEQFLCPGPEVGNEVSEYRSTCST